MHIQKEKGVLTQGVQHHGKRAVNLRQRFDGHIRCRRHLLEHIVHQCGNDIALFGKMSRQIAYADGERIGNRAHGNMVITLFVKKPQGTAKSFAGGNEP